MNSQLAPILGWALIWTASMLFPINIYSAGFDAPGSAPCGGANAKTGQFTLTTAAYQSNGQCTTYGSLGAPRHFAYNVTGSYVNGVAEEIIDIPPPSTSEPSHPYGRWHTKYSCPSDPWLTPDLSYFEARSPHMRCPILSRTGPTPAQEGPRTSADGKALPTIGQIFALWSDAKPMSAWGLTAAQRQALIAKRDADLAEARRKTNQRLKADLTRKSPLQTTLSPLIIAPSRGQQVPLQTPVPIKLGPPNGWNDPSVNLDGSPVPAEAAKRSYLIRLERRDRNGNWVAHTTLPVGGIQGESPAGYVGFGAGAPPGGSTSPGSWRISAQMTSPFVSGWSDWVVFGVTPPVSLHNSTVQRAPKLFQP